MSDKTVNIASDGSVTVTKSDDGAAPVAGVATTGTPIVLHAGHHHGSDHPDPGSVFLGIVLGAGGLWLTQRRRARQRHRPVDLAQGGGDQARMAADVAALARRTATLETIVTDPAQRTAREIDALR